jgi:hypothetical protein
MFNNRGWRIGGINSIVGTEVGIVTGNAGVSISGPIPFEVWSRIIVPITRVDRSCLVTVRICMEGDRIRGWITVIKFVDELDDIGEVVGVILGPKTKVVC